MQYYELVKGSRKPHFFLFSVSYKPQLRRKNTKSLKRVKLKKILTKKKISLGYSEQLFEFSMNEFFIFIKPFRLVYTYVLKRGIVRSHHLVSDNHFFWE